MPAHETADAAAVRLVRETREVAGALPFEKRADLLRDVVKAIRDAVKFDPLAQGAAPAGMDWELEGIGVVGDAAENYYYSALNAKIAADRG